MIRKGGRAVREKIRIGELINKEKCAVIGIGVSNRPLIDHLLASGADVCAYDQKDILALDEIASELMAKGVKLSCGEGYLDELCEKVIFRSPGIRPDIEPFLKAKEAGAVVSTEMELFLSFAPPKYTPLRAATERPLPPRSPICFSARRRDEARPRQRFFLAVI